VPSYAELVTGAEPAARRLNALDRRRIAVCVDTSSIASGALETLAALRDAVASRGLDVEVAQVGGNGMSFANPVVEVGHSDGTRILYQRITATTVPAFLDAVIVRGEPGLEWVLGALDESPGGDHRRMESYEWWRVQNRRLMRDMGAADPDEIDEYIARGAYAGLDRALAMGPEAVIEEVLSSRLRGRSGSDFPTGRKWDFLRTSPTTPKTMVCNADEGDPGAWVNRLTLENDPHALIEGMVIGAWATGAVRGYIYIREEYPLAVERTERAVEQARERGLLGARVLDRDDFSFDLKVIRGAGSYVCGEESGLIASIEDARGMPKLRPPFPAASGVFGQGSNVNNVETYHSVAWLFRNSLADYLALDTGRNAGTMIFTLSGNVQRVGAFEVAMGTPVREVYEVCGGGPPPGRQFRALQSGGPLAGIMSSFALEIGLEPEQFREKGMAAMGGGGLVFLDDSACIVDLCAQFEWFLEDESCGRCTTCHGGTQRMVEIVRRIQRGGGRESDAGKLRLLANTLRYSNCIHGQAAPAVIVNTLDFFQQEFEEHVFERRCRARVCKGLIRYEVDGAALDRPEVAAARGRADQLCPNALTGATEAACLSCAVCKELLGEAIRVVDAFEAGLGPAPEPISVQPAER
jgi:NADH:ubiquinone oxidoreductase subunit F (NADH-binding)